MGTRFYMECTLLESLNRIHVLYLAWTVAHRTTKNVISSDQCYGLMYSHYCFVYMYIWQRIKNIGFVIGLGGHCDTSL